MQVFAAHANKPKIGAKALNTYAEGCHRIPHRIQLTIAHLFYLLDFGNM